ncbi:hypothetical protein BCR42DRAFT_422557 [Absidia repens]|uniref:Uncharacterized protein n=1 Tax=Absidia repens TaxID=90262 RepID=A0A1X2I8B8_9FUNG|nr:hypothetical protein BCR42DRAFT_422557 [Absidia repens]
MANIDALTEEWVKKLHFQNRVDLNLQTPTSGDSMKVEVGDIPPEHLPGSEQPHLANAIDSTSQLDTAIQHGRSHSIPVNDSYLSSIVSDQPKTAATIPNAHDNTLKASGTCQNASDCECYKCQRQRRRTGTRSRTIPIEPSLTTLNNSSVSLEQRSHKPRQQHNHQYSLDQKPPAPTFKSQGKELLISDCSATSSPEQQPTTSHSPQVSGTGSFIQRKRPSNISYERHLPRPTYSELDSIYRGQLQQQHHHLDKTLEAEITKSQNLQPQHNTDSYEISWQDEAGDDILPSLRTFQTIFEEKPHGSEGLSDLLESKTQELKIRNMQEKDQHDGMDQRTEPNRPPKLNDCLTLSYRNGTQHTQLTLYHTMKLKRSEDRMAAYDKALQHCIHADSGLYLWIKNQANQPFPNITASKHRPNFTLKKSTYRSILHLAGRKQKSTAEDLGSKTAKLANIPSSSSDSIINGCTVTPVDILSTTATTTNAMKHIVSVDKRNLASSDLEPSRISKPGKLWSSLGRKTSKTLCTASIDSVEKIYHPPASIKETSGSFEESLDDLCNIMTHVDRSVLKMYLEQSNGDYMKTLSVIRGEVTSGKL